MSENLKSDEISFRDCPRATALVIARSDEKPISGWNYVQQRAEHMHISPWSKVDVSIDNSFVIKIYDGNQDMQ